MKEAAIQAATAGDIGGRSRGGAKPELHEVDSDRQLVATAHTSVPKLESQTMRFSSVALATSTPRLLIHTVKLSWVRRLEQIPLGGLQLVTRRNGGRRHPRPTQ